MYTREQQSIRCKVIYGAIDEISRRKNKSLSLKTALKVIETLSLSSVIDNAPYTVVKAYTIKALIWAFDKGGYTLVKKKELENLRKIRDKYRSID